MESTTYVPQIYPPSATTERGYKTIINVSNDGKWMCYCVNSVVVIRSLEDFKTTKILKGHLNKTTAAQFAPNNKFIASGDNGGALKIWNLEDLKLKKDFNNGLNSNKINGIEWNDESNKIFLYGEGKSTFARCIDIETGKDSGEFPSHFKTILTGDMTKSSPFKVVTGGEDYNVNFYEGPSYKYLHSLNEHTNFVSGVKFSPDDSKFVSVGFDKKIVLYDTTKGSVIYVIADKENIDNHLSAIMGVCWINNNLIGTCSMDKVVKIWDINEKVVKFTLYPRDKKSLDIPDIACGINTNEKFLFTLSFNGMINFWDISDLTNLFNEKLPDKIVDGHQTFVSSIIVCKTKNLLVSADMSGKVIQWERNDNEYLNTILNLKKMIVTLLVDRNEKTLFVLIDDGSINAYNLESLQLVHSLKLEGSPKKLAASLIEDNLIFALTASNLYSIQDGKILNQVKLDKASSFDINEKNNEIYVGNNQGLIDVFNLELQPISQHKIHLHEITAIKVSHDGNLIASGDTNKTIYILKQSTKEIAINRFQYHNAKIFDFDWSSDDTTLLSASLDLKVILWSIEKKSKLKIFENFEVDAITSLRFVNETEFVTGGYSCAIRKFLI